MMNPHNRYNRYDQTEQFMNQLVEVGDGLSVLEEKDLCYIDEETARSLELIHNNVDSANKRHSLFGYLNSNTSTTSGTRLIRTGIRAPLYHLPTIEHRLDCIEYLVSRVDTLSTITNSIRKFGFNVDLDNIVPGLVALYKTHSDTLQMAEKRLEAITTIEALVSQVPVLIGALESTNQHTLNIYRAAIEDPAYRDILNDIFSVIEPDLKPGRGRRSKMFKIRQGVDNLFDIARSTYNAAIDDVEQYVRELSKHDGISWKLNYGTARGYYLSIGAESLPKSFRLETYYVQIVRTRTQVTCTTKDLMQSNVRASVSYENSMKLANEILTSLLASVINNLGYIHKLVDTVGMLDLVTSFAKLVLNSNGTLVRPKFTATDTIITKARHPVLESVLSAENMLVVPNDILFSVMQKNFMLITGPNMGGKSVYLKQIGLIQVMAQLGCFVPAESAILRLVNCIVARSGTSDDMQSNCSSFMWEMKGIASALQNDGAYTPNPDTLYIIDEVGRGTTIDDGASFSFAIAEELATRKNCFTVFATHFEQVFTLCSLYTHVRPYHLGEIEMGQGNGINNSHKLLQGVAENDHYGIRLAEACGLPEEITQAARKDMGIA